MDENFFYILLVIFFIYYSSQNISELLNSNIFDVNDIFEEISKEMSKDKSVDKSVVKYEDKYLDEIRKHDKEIHFSDEEKEILKEKEVSFLNTTENNYKNKIKEFISKLDEIQDKLSKLQSCDQNKNKELNEEDEKLEDEKLEDEKLDDEEWEEEYTKEEKIEILNIEKEEIYIEVKKINDLLDDKNNLLNKAKEFAFNFVMNLHKERLLNCYVIEFTPQGNVLMIYDNKKESFKYYSDNTIPYKYLEVVARKYVKQFNCRYLYVDMNEELELYEKKNKKENEEEKEEEEKENIIEKKNVFAKFKTYNKEGANGRVNIGVPPKNSIPNKKEKEKEKILLKERTNRYTYEGKFINFNFLKKIERKMIDKKYNLSFSDFKKIKKN